MVAACLGLPAADQHRCCPPTVAGKASWIAGTTFLILVVPLIIEMDREQQVGATSASRLCLLAVRPCSRCCLRCSHGWVLSLTPPPHCCACGLGLQLVEFESNQLNALTGSQAAPAK